MSKRNIVLDQLQNHRPNLETVKKWFFEHWPLIQTFGPVNYMCLHGNHFYPESSEEVFAFYLLGAVKIFEYAETMPGSAEEAWGIVQFLLEDLLPEPAQVKFPVIEVKFRKVGEA